VIFKEQSRSLPSILGHLNSFVYLLCGVEEIFTLLKVELVM